MSKMRYFLKSWKKIATALGALLLLYSVTGF